MDWNHDRAERGRSVLRGHRLSHLRAVLTDTPAASAAERVVQPASIRLANKARPDGVSRAFLCTFIRGTLRLRLVLRNPSFSAHPRVNNLHSFDS